LVGKLRPLLVRNVFAGETSRDPGYARHPLPRPADDARQHADERRALAFGDLPALPPRSPDECGRLCRCGRGSGLRPAHGLHRLRNCRRGRAAELAGASAAGHLDRRSMAAMKETVPITLESIPKRARRLSASGLFSPKHRSVPPSGDWGFRGYFSTLRCTT